MEYCLFEIRKPNTPVIIIKEEDLISNCIDRKLLRDAIDKSLSYHLTDEVRPEFKIFLEKLSKKINIQNLYPQRYVELDKHEKAELEEQTLKVRKAQFLEVLSRLASMIGEEIPIALIVEEFNNELSEEEVNDIIQDLKRAGDIYSPKHGFVSRL